MKKTYALISCGKDKTATASRAKDLYLGDLFKKCRAYAEMQGRTFYILSALHGLLDRNTIVEPYDKTLNGATPAENKAWAARVAAQIHDTLPEGATIEVYAGREYRKNLVKLLEADGYEIVLPLEGVGGIGSQKAWLKAKLEEGAAAAAQPRYVASRYNDRPRAWAVWDNEAKAWTKGPTFATQAQAEGAAQQYNEADHLKTKGRDY